MQLQRRKIKKNTRKKERKKDETNEENAIGAAKDDASRAQDS